MYGPPNSALPWPWYHNIALIEKLKETEERLWYARQAIGMRLFVLSNLAALWEWVITNQELLGKIDGLPSTVRTRMAGYSQ